MKPTRAWMLVALFCVSTSLGWSLARLTTQWTGQVTLVGWSMPTTMGLLATALLIWTLLARPRLLRGPGHAPLPPATAARTAALALAASRVGTFVAGTHSGLLIAALAHRQTEGGRDEVTVAAVTVVLSLGFAAVGRWLESLCRIKSDGDRPGAGGAASAKDNPAGSAARSPNA